MSTLVADFEAAREAVRRYADRRETLADVRGRVAASLLLDGHQGAALRAAAECREAELDLVGARRESYDLTRLMQSGEDRG